MKWSACYIVLNEADYIWYSLKSVYDFVDEIVIVHGSTQYAEMVDKNGLSVDNTDEVIQRFIKEEDKQKKIKYIKVGKLPTKKELRNLYLNHATGDWILVVDGDEIMKHDELLKLEAEIEKDPTLVHILYPQQWFWGDFNHVCQIKERVAKTDERYNGKWLLFKDKKGYIARQGEFHERCFKKGFRYRTSHSVVSDSEGKDVYFEGKYEKQRLVMHDVFRYHYGYIKPRKNLDERFKYYSKRDKTDLSNTQYFRWLRGEDVSHPLYEVVKFAGTHPKVMESHPYFNKHVNEI